MRPSFAKKKKKNVIFEGLVDRQLLHAILHFLWPNGEELIVLLHRTRKEKEIWGPLAASPLLG